jgi:ankyrin repeat protein
VELGASPVAATLKGNTPLHGSAYKGHYVVCALLHACGADLEARNNAGETALYRAAAHNQMEACLALLRLGADLGAKDVEGRSPLDVCSPDLATAMKLHKGSSLSA